MGASISRLSGKRNYVIVSFVANVIWFIARYTKIGVSLFLFKKDVQTQNTKPLIVLTAELELNGSGVCAEQTFGRFLLLLKERTTCDRMAIHRNGQQVSLYNNQI